MIVTAPKGLLPVSYAIGLLLAALWMIEAAAQPATKPPGSDPKPGPPAAREGTAGQETPPQETKPEPSKVVTSPILTAKLALMADPRLFPYDLNVEMNGDTLTLKGKVPSDAQRQAAAEVVRSLAKTVKNALEVSKEADRERTQKQDEAITQYVKERFSKSKTLETANFGVKTEDGVVSLSGKTRFQVIVLEAAEAARQVPGVKAVKSDGIRLESE
jgi:hyperosmotically inducible protein